MLGLSGPTSSDAVHAQFYLEVNGFLPSTALGPQAEDKKTPSSSTGPRWSEQTDQEGFLSPPKRKTAWVWDAPTKLWVWMLCHDETLNTGFITERFRPEDPKSVLITDFWRAQFRFPSGQ